MANQKAATAVQQSLDSATSDPKAGVPGLVFVSINKDGEIIQANASGKRGLGSGEAMDLDTTFCIFSCTKLVANIVCLQLVEQGVLKLDDAQHLYKHCPELEKVQVIQDDLTLKPKKNDITLRMLLTHMAGFGYEFFNEKVRDYCRPMGYNVLEHLDEREFLNMPLVHEPGTRWEYGINLDWAGIYAERATGIKLNDLIQKQICQPLGLKSVTMHPTDAMKQNLAHMHHRSPDGSLTVRDHPARRALQAETAEEKSRLFNSGGAGLWAKPVEYVEILAALLNDGVHAKSGARILSAATVNDMFKNQIPDHPDFARQPIPAAKPEYTNPIPQLFPQPNDPPQGWGLSMMLTIDPAFTGRGKNTGWWAGISNLFWWCDREKGVAGMVASQVLPFADRSVMGQWLGCEKAVYDSLEKSRI